MKNVEFRIDPPIARGSAMPLKLEETLPYEAFNKVRGEYVSSYSINGQVVEYGKNSLYQIYVDVCEEIDKIMMGKSHDLNMSFYPVFMVTVVDEVTLKIDNISANSPEPRLIPTCVSREELKSQLVNAKEHIERFVG